MASKKIYKQQPIRDRIQRDVYVSTPFNNHNGVMTTQVSGQPYVFGAPTVAGTGSIEVKHMSPISKKNRSAYVYGIGGAESYYTAPIGTRNRNVVPVMKSWEHETKPFLTLGVEHTNKFNPRIDPYDRLTTKNSEYGVGLNASAYNFGSGLSIFAKPELTYRIPINKPKITYSSKQMGRAAENKESIHIPSPVGVDVYGNVDAQYLVPFNFGTDHSVSKQYFNSSIPANNFNMGKDRLGANIGTRAQWDNGFSANVDGGVYYNPYNQGSKFIPHVQAGVSYKFKDGGPLNEYQNGGTAATSVNLHQVKIKGIPKWIEDKNKLDPDQIDWYESLNPKKWGLNDYSDYSSFNSAFRNSREAGEKEFVYKGKRYNTDLIPKKDSDEYWKQKQWLENYYKTNPVKSEPTVIDIYDYTDDYFKDNGLLTKKEIYSKLDSLYDEMKNISNDSNYERVNQIYNQIQELKKQLEETEQSSLAKNQNYIDYIKRKKSEGYINSLNDPNYYFSITNQKPEDLSADGYTEGIKKIFMVTNAEKDKLNDTYLHELAHKASSHNYTDLVGGVPLITSNPNHWHGEQMNYLSDPAEIYARKMATLYYLDLNKKLKKNDKGEYSLDMNTLEELYNDKQNNKLPYDIVQLLDLYTVQRNDLLDYLNGTYKQPDKKTEQKKYGGRLSKYQNGGAGIASVYQENNKPDWTNVAPEQWQPNNEDLRADRTQKGTGYFGVLNRPDGGVSTEISIGVDVDGKEVQIPTLVPTLSQEEINYLLTTPVNKKNLFNTQIGQSIQKKAMDFAHQRMSKGLSPFYQEGEERSTLPQHKRGGSTWLDNYK